jgi:hypothetical protein
MIRRQVGDEYWLITQNDHAIISGQLARALGNARFEAPAPRAVRGIELHDCGWPTHDENPTLNSRRQPLDVFETPRQIGLSVWTESSKRAAAEDPYAGLLVSLHSLSLSILATTMTPFAHERFDPNDPRGRFEVNQFQHQQIELQESLRQRLGLRTDQPLRHGLAEGSTDPVELQLQYDFRLLQAMDKLSLAICCTKPPAATIEPVIPSPGNAPLSIRVTRKSDDVHVDPWPFGLDRIEVSVPYRRTRSGTFPDEHAFREMYANAPVELLPVSLTNH